MSRPDRITKNPTTFGRHAKLSVVHVLGSMVMMFSVTCALPMLTAIIYRNGHFHDFVVAALVCLGVGGMQLCKAEAPGRVKNEKLTPRITETAKALWFV